MLVPKRALRRPRGSTTRPWRFQNHDAYLPAAQQWAKFIDTYRSDPRCDRAFHNLGICYLKADKLDLARQCFEIVVKNYPKFDLLDATYLYLGVTQYNLARSGKVEMYDAAAATFHTVITKYPESAQRCAGPLLPR